MENNLENLIKAYINEKSTQKLLPYNNIIDEFNSLLKNTNNECDRVEERIVRTVKELEAQRIKYYVKEYILHRFRKIKKNIFLSENLMSEQEIIFYRKYLQLLSEQNVLTSQFAEKIEYVGFYCTNNLKNIKIDDEIAEISEGDFLVANIEDVIEYLISGHILLV